MALGPRDNERVRDRRRVASGPIKRKVHHDHPTPEHTHDTTHNHDPEYVNVDGDTMTGSLSIQSPGDRLTVGVHAFRDVSGKLLIQIPTGAIVELGPNTGGDKASELRLRADLTKVYGHVEPTDVAVYDLGTATQLWRDIRAYGTVQGRIIQLGPAGQSTLDGLADGFTIKVAGTSRWTFTDGDGSTFSAFRPVQDNYSELGTDVNRWKEVWAANGTIQTSDTERKHGVRPVVPADATARVLRVADEAAIHFVREGGKRFHAGFSAQKIGEIHGDTSAAYIDPAINATTDEQRNAPKGLRTDELIADLYASLAHAHRRIDELEARLTNGQ